MLIRHRVELVKAKSNIQRPKDFYVYLFRAALFFPKTSNDSTFFRTQPKGCSQSDMERRTPRTSSEQLLGCSSSLYDKWMGTNDAQFDGIDHPRNDSRTSYH
mmetsp:Transcript_18656/g.27899  ORF Transcript_18656/g.27899 Transcript_18656/m.27899 type:complete len:102 (+) Transcript_18656:1087-1392(+)